MKKIFSILFALVLLVSLGLVTTAPVLADSREVTPGWTDIVKVTAGVAHTVGVKDVGTVVAVGYNGDGQCDVGGWTDITEVAAGEEHTVGLQSDGTIIAVGNNDDGQCDVGDWTDIDQVAAGGFHTVGLRSDGTVVAVGSNFDGQCDVGGWTDITQVAAGDSHTVGLQSDGTVFAVGYNDYGQCDIEIWTNIIQVAAGGAHTVGLKSNGTVVAVGNNGDGQCDVGDWTDIDKVAAGRDHTVGLKSDGTVVAVGNNNYGQCGDRVTETVTGGGTVDATDEADTKVVVTGTATITVFPYDDNPGGPPPTGFITMGKYIDVYVPDISQVTEIEIRLHYTDAELNDAGIDEESLRLAWLDGDVWNECSDTGVITTSTNGYSGYIWAKITATTTPSLDELQGTGWNDVGWESGGTVPQPSCFIATAAYGTDTAKELDILREFRDEVLLPDSMGAKLVSFYYRTSPPIANFISQHEVLRTAVRVGFVDPIVAILNWSHSSWSAGGSQ